MVQRYQKKSNLFKKNQKIHQMHNIYTRTSLKYIFFYQKMPNLGNNDYLCTQRNRNHYENKT